MHHPLNCPPFLDCPPVLAPGFTPAQINPAPPQLPTQPDTDTNPSPGAAAAQLSSPCPHSCSDLSSHLWIIPCSVSIPKVLGLKLPPLPKQSQVMQIKPWLMLAQLRHPRSSAPRAPSSSANLCLSPPVLALRALESASTGWEFGAVGRAGCCGEQILPQDSAFPSWEISKLPSGMS